MEGLGLSPNGLATDGIDGPEDGGDSVVMTMNKVRHLYDDIWSAKAARSSTSLGRNDRRIIALELLQFRSKLLDVGCGDGGLLTLLSGFQQVVGVDIALPALQKACDSGLDARQVDLNAEDLPFPDASFQSVVCLDVIEHVIDPLHLVAELCRVTARGGELIVSTPNLRYCKRILELVVLGRFPRTSGDSEGYDGGHLHYFTCSDVSGLLSTYGFHVTHRVGIIPRQELALLRRYAGHWPVREFLSSGIVVRASAG